MAHEQETQFFLRVTDLAQARGSLTALGLGDLLPRPEDGGARILGDNFTDKYAVKYFPTIVLEPAVWDNTDPENPVLVTPAVTANDVLMVRAATEDTRGAVLNAFWTVSQGPNGRELTRKPNQPGLELIEITTNVWL